MTKEARMKTVKCRWCPKKGIAQMGWIDSKGEWRSEYMSCRDHLQLSISQQDFECRMEQMREYHRMLATKPLAILASAPNV